MTDKMKKAVEAGKDVLIVLLTCSALWLAGRTRLPAQDPGGYGPAGPGQSAGTERVEALRPLRIYANGVGAAGTGRCVMKSDTDAAAFQQAVGMLNEAMSAPQKPEQVTRRHWEEMLVEEPGLCFDFYGEIPLEVLGGENGSGGVAVRRVALSLLGGDTVMYYWDESRGTCLRSKVQTVAPARLRELLTTVGDTGAFFAFESEWFENMDPDTLLQNEMPVPKVYAASNPAANGQQSLEELLVSLGFSLSTSSFYTSGDEVVARNGSDMLRLSDRGSVHYEADSEGTGHFAVPGAWGGGHDLLQQVDLCRRIAAAAIGERMGEARLCLSGVWETEEGTQISFDYSLDGVPVRFQSGYGARFVVRDGTVTQFDLRLRSYTGSGEEQEVLPPRQAAAALSAMGMKDRELMLIYSDSGTDKVTADWAAIGRSAEGK